MTYGVGLGGAEERMESLLADVGRVGLELIELGEVTRYPDIEIAPVDEGRGVRDDRAKVFVIELITAKLARAELTPRDDHRLETYAVLEDKHVRVELQLPAGVNHLLGDDDLETEVHPTVPLGYVSEAGRDDSGVDHVMRHHLAGLLILHGFH